MLYTLFRLLHFLAIIGFAGAIIIENMAMKPVITDEDAHNLAKVDAVYGISATLVLIFGLVLWLGVGKPAAFYNSNPVFLAKMGLFVLMALVSIRPMLFFLRHKRTEEKEIAVPDSVTVLLRTQLALLVIIPVLASLMARGIGLPA